VTETITIRLRRAKSELKAKAKPNINSWLNNLIDQALGPKTANWNEHFARRAKGKPVKYCSADVRKASR
jgi:hypothetical protein